MTSQNCNFLKDQLHLQLHFDSYRKCYFLFLQFQIHLIVLWLIVNYIFVTIKSYINYFFKLNIKHNF